MSTNVYRSEQLVHYAAEPVTYFGFYISWSGGEDDTVYPFSNAERLEDWVRAVRDHMDGADDYEVELAAAMLACAAWGPESTRDSVAYAFEDRYSEQTNGATLDTLRELSDRFDPSEPPGTALAVIPCLCGRGECPECGTGRRAGA